MAVPGGASVSFEDAPAPQAPSPAPRPPSPAALEEYPRPTGRQAAEAALRERALRAPGPRVGAADDDSASIDDEDISDSSVVGLAAVLEVLGGRVIEEKTTEGTY